VDFNGKERAIMLFLANLMMASFIGTDGDEGRGRMEEKINSTIFN
jgi:hypothetical protein